MTFSPMLPLAVLLPILAALFALAFWQIIHHRKTRLVRDWSVRLVLILLLAVLSFRPAIAGSTAGASADGGLEVYFVVDTTSSMVAEDYGDNSPRLDGVRSDISALAQSLTGAEFALITFDSTTVQRMPLTTDLSALRSSVTVLTQEVTGYSAGSSIDAPVELLSTVLTQAEAENPDRPRVVYYFGDGEQTVSTEPGSFEQLAGNLDGGAVLGYGTAEGGRMLSFDGYAETESSYIQDYSNTPPTDAISSIDEVRLQSVATELGVAYSHRLPGDDVSELVDGITFELSEVTAETGSAPVELYWIVALPIGLILLWEVCVLGGALREARPARVSEPSDAIAPPRGRGPRRLAQLWRRP